MRALIFVLAALLATPAVAESDTASTERAVRSRFALIVGANNGGPGRVRLQYATGDADAFAEVLGRLGGIPSSHLMVVQEPTTAGLESAFKQLSARLRAAPEGPTELVVYYSGHADENGLLLADGQVAWKQFRGRVEAMPADARISIVDACASGVMLRAKGGHRRPPFLVDQASKVRGSAFVASASADEAAQESDRIRASFFTHALLTGLRGAADVSGDRVVTLGEAYQFAFRETLMRTESTRLGAQHPSYDMQLTGSGDLVLTDLRDSSATLQLDKTLGGRFFARDPAGRLVAELHKPVGQSLELGLPPGKYTVRLNHVDGRQFEGAFALGERGAVAVNLDVLTAYQGEVAVARGGALPPPSKEVILGMSVVPGLDTDGSNASRDFSLNLLAGVTHSVNRLEISGLAGHARQHVHGVQIAGLYAGTEGRAEGVQLGGFGSLNTGLRGAQISGFGALSGGTIEGVQIGGFAALSGGAVDGLQLGGFAALAGGAVDGAQIGGFAALSESVDGLQLAGGMALSEQLDGAQISIVNVGGSVDGAQIGVINIASDVSGMQLGVINVAQRVSGPSIGVVPWVTEGRHHVEVFGTEMTPLNAGFRLGSNVFHTLLAFGGSPGGGDVAAQAALGGHIALDPMWIDIDVFASQVFVDGQFKESASRQIYGARLLAGFAATPWLGVYGGPSWNVAVNTDEGYDPGFEPRRTRTEGDVIIQEWPGLVAGLRFL